MRLLLVEDDRDLAEAVAAALARRGVSCDHAATAADAILMADMAGYEAMLLDLGLPDDDGLVVLRHLRGRRDAMPVIILTARDEVRDRVSGLDAGADDYLIKPFDVDELMARLRAVLRRPGALRPSEVEIGNLRFDPETRLLTVDQKTVQLSSREAELTALLVRRVDHVTPKRLVEDQLFGLDGDLGSNAVEVYVHRLRRKLADAGANVAIETIRGLGYMLKSA